MAIAPLSTTSVAPSGQSFQSLFAQSLERLDALRQALPSAGETASAAAHHDDPAGGIRQSVAALQTVIEIRNELTAAYHEIMEMRF